MDVPRTHDLEELAGHLHASDRSLVGAVDDLRRLTAYAVAPRYPYFPTEQADGELADLLRFADRVSTAVETTFAPVDATEPS